jgi:hypothetical protein
MEAAVIVVIMRLGRNRVFVPSIQERQLRFRSQRNNKITF